MGVTLGEKGPRDRHTGLSLAVSVRACDHWYTHCSDWRGTEMEEEGNTGEVNTLAEGNTGEVDTLGLSQLEDMLGRGGDA